LELLVIHLRRQRKLPAKLTEKERLQYKTKENDWRQYNFVLNPKMPDLWWTNRVRRYRRGILGGNGSTPRSFVKVLAAAPLLSQIAARDLCLHASTAMGIAAKQ
jgi:hypothetical protein